MVQMRRDALRVLHRQPITLLRQWRELRKHGEYEQAETLLPHLLLTVNAIASELGTTGIGRRGLSERVTSVRCEFFPHSAGEKLIHALLRRSRQNARARW